MLGVVALGGLVTWSFLRHDAPPVPPVAEAPAAPDAAPAVDVRSAPAITPPPTSEAVVEPAPVPAPTVHAAPAATAPIVETVALSIPRAAPLTAEKPAPAKRQPPRPTVTPSMQDVALSLVRKGESAFSRQDYSTAIANARAALDVNPGLARAKQLLDEAQRAQQQAMNSISIQ
ncbi:hypothetical protein [Luteibacter yeojuensis]|uniref:hypothetical protein n=1 Tax=Luteibacter yeojuensis TaxID=345309 RepID=UPI001F04F533|nr:hypothetical protein [Luteibacter yeojuensis]